MYPPCNHHPPKRAKLKLPCYVCATRTKKFLLSQLLLVRCVCHSKVVYTFAPANTRIITMRRGARGWTSEETQARDNFRNSSVYRSVCAGDATVSPAILSDIVQKMDRLCLCARPERILPRLSILHCALSDQMFDTGYDYLHKAIIVLKELHVPISRRYWLIVRREILKVEVASVFQASNRVTGDIILWFLINPAEIKAIRVSHWRLWRMQCIS